MICPKCQEVICVPTHKDFIVCSKCNEVIYVMTKRDAEIFFDAIDNPSQPNEALINAAQNRKNATP